MEEEIYHVHYALRHNESPSPTPLILVEKTQVLIAVCIAEEPHPVVADEESLSMHNKSRDTREQDTPAVFEFTPVNRSIGETHFGESVGLRSVRCEV